MDPSFAAHSLLELQLRVARRADQLSRARTGQSLLNLHCWLLAEQEVLRGGLLDSPLAEKFQPPASRLHRSLAENAESADRQE